MSTRQACQQIKGHLSLALESTLEALQTGTISPAIDALESLQDASWAAEQANVEVACLSRGVISQIEGTLLENFDLEGGENEEGSS